VQNDSNSQDTFVGRIAMAWAPIENLTITPAIQYQSRRQNDTDLLWKGLSNLGSGKFISGDPETLPDKDHFGLTSLKAQYDFPSFSVISQQLLFRPA